MAKELAERIVEKMRAKTQQVRPEITVAQAIQSAIGLAEVSPKRNGSVRYQPQRAPMGSRYSGRGNNRLRFVGYSPR